jgi:hypothetical protein
MMFNCKQREDKEGHKYGSFQMPFRWIIAVVIKYVGCEMATGVVIKSSKFLEYNAV